MRIVMVSRCWGFFGADREGYVLSTWAGVVHICIGMLERIKYFIYNGYKLYSKTVGMLKMELHKCRS
jgi:hypothetical protein